MHEGLDSYIAGFWRRARARRSRREARRAEALALARAMAQVLAEEFGAREVWLFGSVLRPEAFHERSDIDLAAAGIPPDRYLAALGRLEELAAGRFRADLVDLDACGEALRRAARERGVRLVGA